MKKLTTKLTAAILTITLTLSFLVANSTCIFAAETPNVSDVQSEASQTAEYVLSALNTVGIGAYNYKEVILIMRSGIDSGDLADQYIELLSSNITDGKLIVDGTENITLYAAYLIALALHGDNAMDIDGNNMVAAFNDVLASYATAEELNTALENPYYYDFIVPAVFSYSEYMEDADTIKSLLCDAIMLNYNRSENECGIDYWGFSGDNNASVIPALNYFSDNAEISDAIADAVAFNESLIMSDGGSRFDNGEYSTASNANSTGAALYLYSILGNENSALSYNALLTFKSTSVSGAYTYYGDENMYACVDALKGMIAYQMALNGETTPFDVSKEVYDINHPGENQEETTTTQEITEETTLNQEATETSITNTDNVETTTASNASTQTGDNPATITILLFLCVLSVITVSLTYKNAENK